MEENLDERTDFEVTRDNPFRNVVKNIGEQNLKMFSIIIFLSSGALRLAKVLESNTYMYIGMGISLFLFFLVGIGESAKMGEIKEWEAKNVLMRELDIKKKSGSNEFGLQKGEPEPSGPCKKLNIEGRPIEWCIGFIIKTYLGRVIPCVGFVDVQTGEINGWDKLLTEYSTDEHPDVIRKIPEEFWAWRREIERGKANG